ncbi:MAG TPA: fused MFS/spermidine synthase [Polyangiales bacterium]|nr:fused MFS/spermidine synthase [Polyangiales bacterium]
MVGRATGVLVLLLAAACSRAAAEECSAADLLAGRAPALELIRRDAALVTDGMVGREGAPWNDQSAVLLDWAASALTVDLGAAQKLTAAYVQADANDSYDLLGSLDGSPGSFALLARFPNVVHLGTGLRARVASFEPRTVRFVRLSNATGDGAFSVSELAVYCKPPVPFPPAFALALSVETTPVDVLPQREAASALRRHVLLSGALGLGVLGLVGLLLGRRKQALAPSVPLEGPLLGMFLASGCAALIYEIVWVHLLRLVIGASALSVGIVLASFMGGMCLGSLLFGRWVARTRAPLRIYALIELGIGLCGLSMPLVLPLVRSVYVEAAGHGPLGIALRAGVAAILLLPPTALMGATLPAIARRYPEGAQSRLAALYAANTLGAVLGCLVCGFYLLAVWDVWVATATAVLLNFSVAAAALRVPALAPQPSTGSAASPPMATPAAPIYVAIGFSGLTALGAQVLWTRLLTLLFGATVYAFSIILAVFLGGLGIGAVLATRALQRGVQPARGLCATQLALVPLLLWSAFVLADVLPYSSPSALTPVSTLHALHVLRALDVMLPAAIAWGMSFPFALAAVRHEDPGRAAGRVYGANTIGAIVGALALSFLVIPAHGTHWGGQVLIVIAALSAALSCASVLRARGVPLQLGAALVVLGMGAASAAFAPGMSAVFLTHGRHIWQVDPGDRYTYIAEGAASTVAVNVNSNGFRSFHVSGRIEASNGNADMRLQRLLGHLSVLAHPKPKRVLVVGLGAGVTAGAIARHAEIERLVICEIEPRVVGAAREFRRENFAVLDDPRVTVVFDDARHYLATTEERFDIITSDPIHPWVRGNSLLFSREYYEIVKAHLTAQGLATQWVPLYDTVERAIQIQLRTFLGAFPQGSVWNSSASGRGYDVVLLGQRQPEPFDLANMQARMEVPRIASSLREVGVDSVVDLVATYGASGDDMKRWAFQVPENRDFSLRLEYISGLGLNVQRADAIYAHMVAQRSLPVTLFRGPPALLRDVRARILSNRVGLLP